MKTCLITSTLILLLSNLSFAQSNNYDPFLGHYTLGGRADLVWFNSNYASSGFEIGHSLFSGISPQQPVTDFRENDDSVISTDGVSGNFLMSTVSQQRRDEAVLGTMESVGDSVVLVRLYVDQYVDGKWTVVPETIDSYKQKASTVAERMLVRMTSGYFDGGPAKDFAIAYDLPDGSNLITIRAFKLDSITGQPVQIASVRDNKLPASLGSQALFDIAAGNFEGNGRDQLVLVENNAPLSWGWSHNNLGFFPHLKFDSYDFDWTTHQLISKDTTTKTDTCYGSDTYLANANNNYEGGYGMVAWRLIQLVLCSGDFIGAGHDQCVCGFAYFSDFTGNNGPPVPCMSYYVQPFSLAPDLSSFNIYPIDYNTMNSHVMVNQYPIWGGTPSWWCYAPMSMAVGDLRGDGKDQLVVSDLDGLTVDTLTSSSGFGRLKYYYGQYSKIAYESHHAIAIADIDGDTTFADSASSNWRPELLFTQFYTDSPLNSPTTESDNTPEICVMKVTSTSPFTLANPAVFKGDYSDSLTPNLMWDGGVLLGDFRGNSIRLGSPKFQALRSDVEPAIIINAPPVGLDVIGDSTYNISDAYPITNNSDAFYSQLVQSSSQDVQVSTETHSSWGVSATLGGGGDFLGVGVKASMTSTYGHDFDKTQEKDSTFTVTSSSTTQFDDLIYATVTDYGIWQYAVYADGALKGHIMAAVADPKGGIWFESNESSYGRNIILDHEPGNLLSYPDYTSDLTSDPDISPGGLIYEGDGHAISQTTSPNNYQEFNWSTMTNTSVAKTESYGFSASASVEGFGLSVETDGSYNHDAVTTHTTTFNKSIDMTANYGAVSSNTEEYTVTPFVYWSVNGALVLDYSVDFPSGNQSTSFWDANYQEPDLTWNCYYRYLVQKGFAGLPKQMADWTKEIQIFPSTPKEGDTVTVLAEIHDYSLKATSGPVQVRFYLSSSDTGGIPVVDLTGDSVFTTSSPVEARGDQMFKFKWQVPSGLTTSDSVLYGVIDPDNQITEVNKDNNKGWNTITILGTTPTAVRKSPNVVRSFKLLQNYPNPFNPTTMISYQLSAVSNVSLKVYDVLGREVATLVNQMESPGTYDVRFNGSRFASGVYFYRIIAKGTNGKNFVAVKKLMLLK